jgi:predicted DNA-binding transcriptional regulator AlpA
MAEAAAQFDVPPYLTHLEAATYCRMSKSTLSVRIKEGDGPRRIRIGGRVFYLPEDLDAWIEAHEESEEDRQARQAALEDSRDRRTAGAVKSTAVATKGTRRLTRATRGSGTETTPSPQGRTAPRRRQPQQAPPLVEPPPRRLRKLPTNARTKRTRRQ